ncbi:putative inactive protein kinase [Camellia lanceoleosa]|uniref:Inactive protein kinase n=1 Tax=Camellia lanceoleosa TaxID=1840588 RepID=A0ACC0G2H4_9ERIC|nr:putative inactive protein kinase [Camellia lanceoleosa]
MWLRICIRCVDVCGVGDCIIDLAAFSPASWKCSEEYFSQQIKSRDPLKTGFPTVWALRLVRQLLVWDPHPYFQPQPKG